MIKHKTAFHGTDYAKIEAFEVLSETKMFVTYKIKRGFADAHQSKEKKKGLGYSWFDSHEEARIFLMQRALNRQMKALKEIEEAEKAFSHAKNLKEVIT